MKFFNLCWLVLLLSKNLLAQDTLKITLHEADSILLTKNLALIAFHYEVDKAEAARVQAKLFNNPLLTTEWNLYNPDKSRWFDVGKQGQKVIALQQVFRIAGQRNTVIKLAQEQKRITEFQFYEIARSLRYELHAGFFRYYFLNRAITNIRSQLGLLKNLIEVYQQQYVKGNISLQELTRLNTTYFAISNQVSQTQAELFDLQETLRVLLSENRTVIPILRSRGIPQLPPITLTELQQRALQNRPDIKVIESQQVQDQLQLSLEKKEAIPNLTAGAAYDQAGSYIRNYTAVTAGLQLPVFNRNQGRIRAAAFQVQQSKTLLQSKQQGVLQEVETAMRVFNLLRDQFNSIGNDFEQQLDRLSDGLVSNYSKNNISLLEFTDLFEAYNTNIIQINQLKADLNKSYEELNYVVGEDLER